LQSTKISFFFLHFCVPMQTQTPQEISPTEIITLMKQQNAVESADALSMDETLQEPTSPISLVSRPSTRRSHNAQFVHADVLQRIALTFRQTIQPHTVLAFGTKLAHVFSGQQAVDVILNALEHERDAGQLAAGIEVDRSFATSVGQRLIDEAMVFGPVPVQHRTVKGEQEVEDGFFDETTMLYRLTRDALLLGEFNAAFFDRFVALVKDGERGVEFKSEKVKFRKIRPEECVFSERKFHAWSDLQLGTQGKQWQTLLQLLLQRRAFEKLAFLHCYRFIQK